MVGTYGDEFRPCSVSVMSSKGRKGLTEERDNLERCCLDMGGTPSTWKPEDEEGLDPES